MNLSFPASYLQAKLNAELPPPHDMTLDERACRRKAREAEWNFRVSKGYVKDTFWNRLWFRLTHRDRTAGKEPIMDFLLDNLEGRLSSTLPHYDRPDGDEQDCRKRARDAEWNFRVSKGYVKDTFWNRLWFRLTH